MDGKPPTNHVHSLGYQKANRRILRGNLTQAETVLWKALQRSQLAGRKFRRQHSIGPYIVDFYCAAEQLIVELDGARHFTASGESQDAERDSNLTSLGFRVLRFENKLVLNHLESVLAAVQAAFQRVVLPFSTTPSPSSAEEGN
ncbi:endonuclease domain-containing protein [Hymenobacter actinosclerus]|uniref:Very-short-patch-repair endonuclease n=1 Tax=Hymenobacter actinosclerus TaxID=82805 RepID=A0A1I0BHV1_9BACT|nr:endonuclease domain-containing protein [Hymenobacter actinosclerus]SET05820.1 Very-short-patch-repair endonuclease [Hymenobacter actinosclerus]